MKVFWLAHWQYIITTLLAIMAIIAAAIVALFIHFDSKATKKPYNEINQTNNEECKHNQSYKTHNLSLQPIAALRLTRTFDIE